MKNCILTITATCPSLTLDDLNALERNLRQRIACSNVSLAVTPVIDGGVAIRQVLNACAGAFGVTPEEIVAQCRIQRVSFARHAYCHLARASGYTFEQVGEEVRRSYCTVMSSVKASRNMIFSAFTPYTAPFERAKEQVAAMLEEKKMKLADV
jgi:chromosomal replication initiation ATPase DnaA